VSPDPPPDRSSTVTTELLIRDVILGDGSSLRLVAPGPEDYEDVKAFNDRLSPESRYMCFHGVVRTEFPARHVVEAGGVDRFALICRHGGRVVAVASYDRLPSRAPPRFRLRGGRFQASLDGDAAARAARGGAGDPPVYAEVLLGA
jgi:hypothetical protein